MKDLVQEMRLSSQEIPSAAWSLLLSQRQDFLNIHLVRVPNTSDHEVTMEMKDEVFFSVGAKDMDTRGYQVSDLHHVELEWDNDQLDVNAAFRHGIYILFSTSTFNDFEMGSMAGNPTLIDKEQDKENSPLLPHPTTLISGDQPNRLC